MVGPHVHIPTYLDHRISTNWWTYSTLTFSPFWVKLKVEKFKLGVIFPTKNSHRLDVELKIEMYRGSFRDLFTFTDKGIKLMEIWKNYFAGSEVWTCERPYQSPALRQLRHADFRAERAKNLPSTSYFLFFFFSPQAQRFKTFLGVYRIRVKSLGCKIGEYPFCF